MPRNPTPAQQETSRRNGRRSYGARGNNPLFRDLLAHQTTAATVCLSAEDRSVFQTLLESLIAHFRPNVDAEFLRVETLAVIEWRLRRLWDAERATLDAEFLQEKPLTPNEPITLRLARAQRRLADSTHTVDRLQIQESRLIRAYDRTLAQLATIRKIRESREPKSNNRKPRPSRGVVQPEPPQGQPDAIPSQPE